MVMLVAGVNPQLKQRRFKTYVPRDNSCSVIDDFSVRIELRMGDGLGWMIWLVFLLTRMGQRRYAIYSEITSRKCGGAVEA